MTKTTPPSQQVFAVIDPSCANELQMDKEQVVNEDGSSRLAQVSIPKLLEQLKHRQEIRKNGEQSVKPVFTSFAQFKLNLEGVKPQIAEESEDLIARRKFLKIREEERSYNKMMYGDLKNPVAEEVLSKSSQFSSFRHQLSLGVNVLFSILAAFGMMWYIAKNVMMFDESKSLIIGLFSAIVVLLVEMVLFIVRAVRIEDETEKRGSISTEAIAQLRSGGLVTAHFQQQQLQQASPKRIEKSKDE